MTASEFFARNVVAAADAWAADVANPMKGMTVLAALDMLPVILFNLSSERNLHETYANVEEYRRAMCRPESWIALAHFVIERVCSEPSELTLTNQSNRLMFIDRQGVRIPLDRLIQGCIAEWRDELDRLDAFSIHENAV